MKTSEKIKDFYEWAIDPYCGNPLIAMATMALTLGAGIAVITFYGFLIAVSDTSTRVILLLSPIIGVMWWLRKKYREHLAEEEKREKLREAERLVREDMYEQLRKAQREHDRALHKSTQGINSQDTEGTAKTCHDEMDAQARYREWLNEQARNQTYENNLSYREWVAAQVRKNPDDETRY